MGASALEDAAGRGAADLLSCQLSVATYQKTALYWQMTTEN
jgi:hypothetical protein